MCLVLFCFLKTSPKIAFFLGIISKRSSPGMKEIKAAIYRLKRVADLFRKQKSMQEKRKKNRQKKPEAIVS